ncbi:MAG: xanthine dehydrogenase molybdopterin binding subunit, partial [Rhodospirillaceae bacterium]|nr:xanthine dehydrogenase molybdopterin binding subunit [Rhodospirillaceae bacterium]
GEVMYVGQPIFIVVAESHEQARRAAHRARISYEELPAIFTPQQAKAAQQYVLPPMQLQRGDFKTAFEAAPHVVRGQLFVGG